MTTDYSPTSSGYGPAKRAAATPQQVAAAPAKPQSPMAVFFYIPNLIGYGRIIMMLASFRYMPTEPVQAIACYFISSFLDAFDGMAARHFNQESKLGYMLDMLTDRIGTTGLIMSIATLSSYAGYTWVFQVIVCLDIAGHWGYVQSFTLPTGPTHHKKIDLEQNKMLYYYYWKPALFVACSANELFFMTLYLNHFFSQVGSPYAEYAPAVLLTCKACFPIMAVKNFINVLHLYAAAYNYAVYDTQPPAAAKGE